MKSRKVFTSATFSVPESTAHLLTTQHKPALTVTNASMSGSGGKDGVDAIWQQLKQQEYKTKDKTRLESLWKHDFSSGFVSAAACMVYEASSNPHYTFEFDMCTCGDRWGGAHWTGAVEPAVTVW
jgi:hypothetical protein